MKQKIKKIMRKTGIKQLFLLLLLSGIVFACVNDNEPFSDSGRQNGNRGRQPLSPEVIAAQAWFENEVPRGFLAWYTEDTPKGDRRILMPNWRRTLSNENSVYRVTEARIQSNRNLLRVSAESSERFKQTGNRRYLASDTRFVLRTHIETGEAVGFIMIVHPDLAQIQRSRNPLQSFTYLKRDKDFSGFVYFYDLCGEFVNGWRHREGEITPIFPRAMMDSSPQLRSWLPCGPGFDCRYCYFVCWEWWTVTPVYINGEFSHNIYGEPVIDVDTCMWAGCRNPNSNPDPDPGWGGSGSGGFWPPPPQDEDEPEPSVPAVILGVIPPFIEIGNSYTIAVVVINGTAQHVEFQMRRNTPLKDWVSIHSGQETNIERLAWTPGFWDIRAIVRLTNGQTLTTGIRRVEERFPTATRFSSDAGLQAHLRGLWSLAIEYARTNQATHSVREYGAFIRMNRDGTFFAEDVPPGPSVPLIGAVRVSVPFVPRDEILADPTDDTGRWKVGTLHTHFPLTWAGQGVERDTGASEYDMLTEIPGIGIDFEAPRVYAGDPYDTPTRFFVHGINCVFTRRPTIR